MESKDDLLLLIHKYIAEYPSEKRRVEAVLSFINQFDGSDLYKRNNFVGHLTASAFVVNPSSQTVLLIEHSTLKRWLQPGGHIEAEDESILSAALREVEEETNIDVGLLQTTGQIFDIDSHAIPANARKAEPPHVHHDIRFLFTCSRQVELTTALSEVSDCQWVSVNKLAEDETFGIVVQKIRQAFQELHSANH
jgi:8-oxo-dGTP pyrophosphatase MutT (NUDIX family)